MGLPTVKELLDYVMADKPYSLHPEYDYNNDGALSVHDVVAYGNYLRDLKIQFPNIDIEPLGTASLEGEREYNEPSPPDSEPSMPDVTSISGMQRMQVPQVDLGISSGAVGSRKELGRMLESYKGRTSLIQSAQRQKVVYTIDRFDGGLNQNKSPRDLSYWEACQMDCLSPSKVGRLIRLGDFGSQLEKAGLMEENGAVKENYGLHYFKLSDSLNTSEAFAGGTPTNYIAISEDGSGSGNGGDINIWNLDQGTPDEIGDMIVSMHADVRAVYHNASNRVYVSDATFGSSKTYMFGIVDRRKLFPFDASGTLTYNITGDNHLFKDQSLYHAPPSKGLADGNIMVTGTQTASTQVASLTHLMNTAASSGGTQHHGIYINVNFEDITGDEGTSIGWGSSTNDTAKYYKIYASFLYDDGSETKLTDVTSNDNAVGDDLIKATTTDAGVYQKFVVKQVIIDGAGIVASNPRVHGARFYYTEVDVNGNAFGNDKYQWAELDFRYGFKLVSEFGNWNLFEDDNDGSGHSLTTAIQVLNAANANDDTSADGTLSILSPPTAFTYYSLNLFHQEELKGDLMWKVSTAGNGIAFVGNVKYDGREYPDTMLYSGAGETDAGSAYPMWGTFPVDSNRIDIPGAAGEITALKWTSNKILQFRKNAVYVINVEDVLSPRVEGVYQGMGVHGQYAVTETPFGCAWVNDNGAYAYNSEEGRVRSLTIGRLDTEDFGADSTSKIGYDDRAKMLIITNTSQVGADGYHYAYSFVTDAWCSWNGNKAQAAYVKTNFAIDHDGYLTGAVEDGTALDVYKWGATPVSTPTVDYITKDIDFGKPSLDKRLYTLYISYTGGASNEINVYFRVNGMEGTSLTTGWTQLGTVTDYTNPYGTTSTTAWAVSSGSPTTGDPVTSTDDGLDSTVTSGEVQKLAKINLRHLSGSFPDDYFKFARSIQLRFTGVAATTFEINDISLVYKEKRLK